MPIPIASPLLTALSADSLTPGRWFDGLAAGTFTDMRGQRVTFAAGELDEYVRNTRAAIAATRSELGEVVGLPIDARGHERDDGAGWIVDIEAVGGKLRLLPRWTEIGRELIAKSIRRFFSATIDTINRVILGGTLTNWPATRDARGQMLLRPIELSTTLYQLADESLDERGRNIRHAFAELFALEPMSAPYIREVFEGYVIVCVGEQIFQASFTEADGVITFAPRAEWVEVKETYIDAALNFVRALFKKSEMKEATRMTVKLSELSAADRADLVRQVAAQVAPPVPVTSPAGDIAQLLGVPALTPEAQAQLARWAEMQIQAVQARAEFELTARVAQMKRETGVSELVARLTGGTPDNPRGLPADATELKRHLLALPVDEAEYFGGLLTGIARAGLVEFTEIGHGRRLSGVSELAEPFAGLLRDWVAHNGAIAEFFKINAHELGEMNQYDLRAYAPSANNEVKNG